MVLLGLAAAGSAGKASATLACLLALLAATVREGAAEARGLAVVEEAHGVWPGFAPTRPDGAAGRAGNALLDDALDQLACRLADDRDDCAVELFNFSTLEPP